MDVNEDKLQVRNRAISMLLAGSTQKYVANKLGKDIRTVQRWLAKSCLDTLHRTQNNGSVLERKMVPNMSKAVFMQDDAPAYTSKKTQCWWKENLANYWEKTQWPGNSPDLNPIENLWRYLQEELNKKEPAKTISNLKMQPESAWKALQPSFLQALIDGMPEKVKTCIELDGSIYLFSTAIILRHPV